MSFLYQNGQNALNRKPVCIVIQFHSVHGHFGSIHLLVTLEISNMLIQTHLKCSALMMQLFISVMII